jgi:hypothetical protein
MTVNVKWDSPGVVHMEIKGAWTLEEYLHGADVVHEMVTTTPSDCYLIIDMTQSRSIPSGIMPHLHATGHKIPIKGVVLTGLPTVVVMLGSLFQNMGRGASTQVTLWAKTMDDAREKLTQYLAVHQ